MFPLSRLQHVLQQTCGAKIDLSVSDPANNHSAVVAQLQLPPGFQPARDIATDDKGRVYLALGTKIEVYDSNLQTPLLHTISGFTACEGVAVRRANGTLAQNYPSPLPQMPRLAGNPSTVIGFALPEAGKVTVNIYNEIGQLVHTLVDDEMAAGRHAVHWNGRDHFGQTVAAGMFLYRIAVRGNNGSAIFTQTRRMTLLK